MIEANFKGPLEAEYEMKPSIKVHCVLDVLKTVDDAKSIVATVGVRGEGDTFLPVGSKMLIKVKNNAEKGQSQGQIAIVKDVRKQQGQKIHYIDILDDTLPAYTRSTPRVPLVLSCQRGDKIFFKTANVSTTGAQFVYESVLTSAVLGQVFLVEIEIEGILLPFECEVCYILYNWWQVRHKVGVKFLNVEETQYELLKEMVIPLLSEEDRHRLDNSIEPAPLEEETTVDALDDTPVKEVKTMIDPESGRIRFDH